MKKKIYIAGCGGMLGEAFYQRFKNEYDLKCTDKDVNADWLSYLDFRSYKNYLANVAEFKPDFLFHLGALTDLEYCEQNPADAYMSNTLSVEHAVHIANDLNIPLLYICTSGIFDGNQESYDDWDMPNPLGVYARSKYMGERYVIEHCNRYFICRAGWMMGGGIEKDKKFIKKIILQLKEGKRNLYIVNDKEGMPTYTHDFANNVALLIQTPFYGLYNMVCGGKTTRLEITEEIITALGMKEQVRIHSVTSDHFKEEYFAPRPFCEKLINTKLDLRGMNVMRDWRIALREYIDNYYKPHLEEWFRS